MHFFIIVIFICLLVFLFCIYFLSHDDLLFLRKDVTGERIFNLVFIDFLIGLFFARLFYGVLHDLSILLHPLAFILFPYFPGLSLVGGVLGGVAFLILYSKNKNIPQARIVDFFSISFLGALPVGILGYYLLSQARFSIGVIILVLVYIAIFIFFIKFLREMLLKGKIKDGTIGLIFLSLFSFISITSNIAKEFKGLTFLRQPENFIMLAMLLISVFILFRQENLLTEIVKLRKRFI
ncbi:MAG: prolipoprotein diacylglyceryl transferase [Patescibacteria group bacterium]|nr:prolipoprotein diacylglyceryl transferase [Patescibacteria group bacterium]